MTVLHSFHDGGVFMYFILLFGLFTFCFIVERTLALYLHRPVPAGNLREKILPYIRRGDLSGATKSARAFPLRAIGAIAEIACQLRSQASGDEELQSRMDEALSGEIARLDRRTAFLAMFGNVATLLGLLGTISGMIRSFGAVASSSPADRAMLLSKGISEAMNCTAFGLIVAIPALVTYAIFQSRTEKLVGELTDATAKIFHDLLFLYERKRTETKKARPRASRTVRADEDTSAHAEESEE